MSIGKYDTLVESVGGDTDTDNTDISGDCPKCDKKKLYINRDTGLFYCFSCEFRGRAVDLIAEIHGISPVSAKQFVGKYANTVGEANKKSFLRKVYEMTSKEKSPNLTINQVRLPSGAVPIHGTIGERYLSKRGFDKKNYKDYRLLFVPKNGRIYTPADNHIIFPCYGKDGNLDFWSSRAAWDPVTYGPKSTGPRGVSKKGILYGIREFFPHRGDGRMILVEGPLDMLSLNRTGCSLLGKYLSDLQIKEIVKYARNGVIICLDSNESKASWNAAERITRWSDSIEVYVGTTSPYKDAAEALADGKDPVKLIQRSAVRFTEAGHMKAKTS